MSEVDVERLRAVAEAATPGEWYSESRAALRFRGVFDPPTVRALLDRLAAAEATVARVRGILDAWEAWDGSPGPDGRTHPDASSPRDRDRLRDALGGDGGGMGPSIEGDDA